MTSDEALSYLIWIVKHNYAVLRDSKLDRSIKLLENSLDPSITDDVRQAWYNNTCKKLNEAIAKDSNHDTDEYDLSFRVD